MDHKEFFEKEEIKEILNTFSIMADEKDIVGQTSLFTKDAIVKSYYNDQLLSELKGHDDIFTGFRDFLDLFKRIYHINGQQVIHIDGELAVGTSYCLVSLVQENDNKTLRTLQGVRYHDEFIKINGKWLIKERHSYFIWRETDEINE